MFLKLPMRELVKNSTRHECAKAESGAIGAAIALSRTVSGRGLIVPRTAALAPRLLNRTKPECLRSSLPALRARADAGYALARLSMA